MEKYKFLMFLRWSIFVLVYNCKLALLKEVSMDFDTSRAMVTFNPYVSIFDKYKFSRYEVVDLIPLVQKVATRFTMIHIKIGTNDFDEPLETDLRKDSLLNSPLAVANYNCLSKTKTKVEVFLELVFDGFNWNCAQKQEYLSRIMSIAEKANAVCNGTVSTILVKTLPADYFECAIKYFTQNSQHQFHYLFGYSLTVREYCKNLDENLQSNLDVIMMHYSTEYYDMPKINNSCLTSAAIQNLKKRVKLVTSLQPTFYGYNEVVITNMTRLISTWKLFSSYPSDISLLSHAFDYYGKYNMYSTFGWWHLTKDPGNANTTEYVFEEKIAVAGKVDLEENPKNFQWLQRDYKFDNYTTGVSVVTHGDIVQIESQFCRVMILSKQEMPTFSGLNMNLQSRYDNYNCDYFTLYYLPILKTTLNNSISTNTSVPRWRTGWDDMENLYGLLNISVYDHVGQKLRDGYAFPLDICARYSQTNKYGGLFEFLSDQKIEAVAFYFYEDHTAVSLGASRMFRQRKVLFEKCRELTNRYWRGSVEIYFVSVGYAMINKFSINVVALQNFVKYTYLLSNWAKNQTKTVVFLGQYEDKRDVGLYYFNPVKQPIVGLYSYDYNTLWYTSKNNEAFDLSSKYFPEEKFNITEVEKTINLTTNQVFIVVSTSLVASLILVSLIAFLIHRRYKNGSLTKDEIEMFINGDNLSSHVIQRTPYDKERYEVSDNNFTVQTDVPLGSGEFGAVYRGTIHQSFGKLQVAVKTLNPKKIHKTQLTGLLSEIKVLVHVGKHANITELVGANTASLKHGKLYIFLELCHLGSLQKFLREMRLLVSSPVLETDVDNITDRNEYVNSRASNTIVLDAALSNDLYRWSTEICNGMTFLAEKHVVHADLATRNVLLNLRREAKICDFGLSRRMYNYTNYVKTQQEPLPWKWMAPESLKDMVFNEKTDVWAYGVTLWEIYSLAKNPYAGLSWDTNFSHMLERGLNLSEPEYCERNMYARMQKCWTICPESRPTFSELLLMLHKPEDKEADN